MALRSRSRTTTATSGPGRGPHSDGRSRHRRAPGTGGRGDGNGRGRGRGRQRHAASAEELHRRAEVLFAGRAEGRGPGKGPPPSGARGVDDGVVGDGLEAVGAVGAVDAVAAVEVGSADRAWLDDDSGAAAWRDADTDIHTGIHTDIHTDVDVEDGKWRERAGFALRERMPVWLQTRCGLERRNVLALSVLLVVAAVFAVQHFWTGRAQSVQAPEVVRAAAPFGERGADEDSARRGEAEPAFSGGGPGAAGPAGAEIVVDVSGKVREPGIQRLPAGSRVADALRAAGGVRPGTNTDALNRARFLVDGEQVVVGGPAVPAVGGPVAGGPVAGGPAGPGTGAAAPVSLNTATVDQLDTLPGVGPVLAQHIVDYRTQHGGFRSVGELREVNGIGDRRFADLRNLVRP